MPNASIDYDDHQVTGEWPDEWPILEASHISQHGTYARTKNIASLMGWVENVMGPRPSREVIDALRGAILDFQVDFNMARDRKDRNLGERLACARTIPIPLFNDTMPRELVARVWNRAGARLGYVEGNTEASPE